MDWWSKEYAEMTGVFDQPGKLMEERFRKIIFLDIDGVLNDEGEEREKQVIHPAFVSNLARIVKATRADIVLTSSWRGAVRNYYLYERNIGSWDKDNVELLLKFFLENDLNIVSITPMYYNGPDGRPFEIRAWLTRRPNVTHFVILDDDTFWNWGWLTDHFVCTRRSYRDENGLERDVKGLFDECVDKAIEILGGIDEE